KPYGRAAGELVRHTPYRLATDIWGIGFHTADKLAGRLGVDPSSPLRARAALRYVLQQLSHEGHVGFPEEGVIARTVELTGIDPGIVRAAVEDGRKEDELVREPGGEEPWLYLKPLFMAELGVARTLRQLREGESPLAGAALP